MHHPTDRITHTTAFVTPVVEHWLEREIAQWVHPMKDRSDDPSHHERTLYLWATSRSDTQRHTASHRVTSRHTASSALSSWGTTGGWRGSITNTEANNVANLTLCRNTSLACTWVVPGTSSLLVTLVECSGCWMMVSKLLFDDSKCRIEACIRHVHVLQLSTLPSLVQRSLKYYFINESGFSESTNLCFSYYINIETSFCLRLSGRYWWRSCTSWPTCLTWLSWPGRRCSSPRPSLS